MKGGKHNGMKSEFQQQQRCKTCGAKSNDPPTSSGFWQHLNGIWFHWCWGGRPGEWQPAEPITKGDEQE